MDTRRDELIKMVNENINSFQDKYQKLMDSKSKLIALTTELKKHQNLDEKTKQILIASEKIDNDINVTAGFIVNMKSQVEELKTMNSSLLNDVEEEMAKKLRDHSFFFNMVQKHIDGYVSKLTNALQSIRQDKGRSDLQAKINLADSAFVRINENLKALKENLLLNSGLSMSENLKDSIAEVNTLSNLDVKAKSELKAKLLNLSRIEAKITDKMKLLGQFKENFNKAFVYENTLDALMDDIEAIQSSLREFNKSQTEIKLSKKSPQVSPISPITKKSAQPETLNKQPTIFKELRRNFEIEEQSLKLPESSLNIEFEEKEIEVQEEQPARKLRAPIEAPKKGMTESDLEKARLRSEAKKELKEQIQKTRPENTEKLFKPTITSGAPKVLSGTEEAKMKAKLKLQEDFDSEFKDKKSSSTPKKRQ